MTKRDLPDHYQLCRIAAALGGNCTKLIPAKAVKAAMLLWSAAVQEIDKEQAALDAKEQIKSQNRWNDRQAEERIDTIGSILRSHSDGHEAEAMNWINTHATNERDRCKTLFYFRRAWVGFCSASGYSTEVPAEEELWDAFLKYRVKNRLAAEAERKRRERKRKASAKKASRKISAGHKGTPRRKSTQN